MNRIRQIRKEHGLKQNDLAAKIGCSPSSLIRWEAEGASPPVVVIEKIADVLGVNPAWLAGWSEKPRTVVETVKVIGYDQHLAELERQNAYLQRRLQSREYSLELYGRTWGGKTD